MPSRIRIKRKAGRLPTNNVTAVPEKGIYKCSVGKEYDLLGNLRAKCFYLGPKGITLEFARAKRAIINAEWQKLKTANFDYWTAEALQSLVEQGVINPISPTIRKDDALRLFPEPLNNTELEPYCDERGHIKIENAIPVAQLIALKELANSEFRTLFARQLQQAKRRDPWGTLERVVKTFGLTGQQALNIVLTNTGVTPMAFDASEQIENQSIEKGETIENEPTPTEPTATDSDNRRGETPEAATE